MRDEDGRGVPLARRLALPTVIITVATITTLLLAFLITCDGRDPMAIFLQRPAALDRQYGVFPERLRLEMRDAAREMFDFAFDGYMRHAFPRDELNPIDCVGRGPDVDNP